jgi:glucose-1-phosphate adenylyltransferase
MAFKRVEKPQATRFGVGRIELEAGKPGGRLRDYAEKPETIPDWPEDECWASLTIYLFSAKVLAEVLAQHALSDPKTYEFGKDIIPAVVKDYRVFGYTYEGYWGYTRTIDEYWQTNMDMLGEKPKIDPERWRVRTNLEHNAVRDRAPALIGAQAKIENSLIYSGCRVYGSVKNSILFPGVEIGEGVQVDDSILMFDAKVAPECVLHKVITDSDVEIGRGCLIGNGDPAVKNEEYPELLRSGITLIGRAAVIPEQRKIGSNCIVHPELVPAQFHEMKYESGVSIT